jgi:hypothetical protein
MTQKDGSLEIVEPLRQQRMELDEAAGIEMAQCDVMRTHVAQIGLSSRHQWRG